jgi:hypothetical protein
MLANVIRMQSEFWQPRHGGAKTEVQLPDGDGGYGHGPYAGLLVRWCREGWVANSTGSDGQFLVKPVGAPAEGAKERAAELQIALNQLPHPLSVEVGRALPHLTKGIV